MRMRRVLALAACALLAPVAASAASACRPPCATGGPVRGSAVIPPDDQFTRFGDAYSSRFQDLNVRGNGATQVQLPFAVNFGFGAVNSLFVNENGAVSFGSAITGRAQETMAAARVAGGPLANLGVPVIAPFFKDLVQGAGAGDGQLEFGDVAFQVGQADPYPNGGAYQRGDLVNSFRITWWGLTTADSDQPVFAQVEFYDEGQGDTAFAFRWGMADTPGQDGLGSVAGWSLGSSDYEFSGDYRGVRPDFFEFHDGAFIGQYPGAAPEPSSWSLLIVGVGAVGAWLRRRRMTAEAA